MASTIFGCWKSPGTPSEMERSAGPIITASIPGTERISSRASTARFDSICSTVRVFALTCSMTSIEGKPGVLRLGRLQAVAANARRRKFRPAESGFEQLRIFHARKNDALRAAIESARHQAILQIDHPNNRAKPGKLCDAADVLNGFEIEAAMFGIDERPVKAGGGEKARDLRRSQLAEIHARAGVYRLSARA